MASTWRIFGGNSDIEHGSPSTQPTWGAASATETNVQFKDYNGYTWSELAVYVETATSTGATFDFRDDGSTNTTLSVSLASTGLVEDTAGTITPAANSLVNWLHDASGDMHGDRSTIRKWAVGLEHASAGAPLTIDSAVSQSSSTTLYIALNAATVKSQEVERQSKIYAATVVDNLGFSLDQIAASGNTLAPRDDGVTSTNLSLSPTGSGRVEDTTGSDTWAADSLVNFISIVGFGTTLLGNCIQLDTDAVDSVPQTQSRTITQSVDGTNDTHLAGDHSPSLLPVLRIGSNTCANLRAYCTAIRTGFPTQTVKARVANVDSSNLVCTFGATGAVEDTTGSETVGDTDEFEYRQELAGGLAGNFIVTLRQIDLPGIASQVVTPPATVHVLTRAPARAANW
jgi:hypothetical protein